MPQSLVKVEGAKGLFQRCYETDCKAILLPTHQGGTYISWANAWTKLKLNFPDASYEVREFGPDQLPYQKTEFGLFVQTYVTIENTTLTMRLPVMDHTGNTAKNPDAREVSDNIMRCLVKNIALHGLGISAWEKDDVNAQPTTKRQTSPNTQVERPKAVVSHPPDTGGAYRIDLGTLKSGEPHWLNGRTLEQADHDFNKKTNKSRLEEVYEYQTSVTNPKYRKEEFLAAAAAYFDAKRGAEPELPLEPPPHTDQEYEDIPF